MPCLQLPVIWTAIFSSCRSYLNHHQCKHLGIQTSCYIHFCATHTSSKREVGKYQTKSIVHEGWQGINEANATFHRAASGLTLKTSRFFAMDSSMLVPMSMASCRTVFDVCKDPLICASVSICIATAAPSCLLINSSSRS